MPSQPQQPRSAQLFPAFLKLQGRSTLLVGGGAVAQGKLRALLDAGADVTLVAPEIRTELVIEHEGVVQFLRRPFEARDLDGRWFVVSAAPALVNREVARLAEERRIFVNAVDDLAAASAYLGGVVRRGPVALAISTDGRAPALAGLLREALDHLLPNDLEEWVGLAERLRVRWRAQAVPIAERRPLLLQALQNLYKKNAVEAGGVE